MLLVGSIPASADAAITTVTGQKPARLSTADPYRVALLGRAAVWASQNAARGVTDPTPQLLDGTVFLVADDDRPALLAALGMASASGYGYGGTVFLTNGTKLPDALKSTLAASALKNAKLLVVGAHAQQAWNAWSGHTAVQAVSAATPAALAVSLEHAAAAAAPDYNAPVLLSAAVLPVPTSQNLVSELALAASGGEAVFFADPAAAPDAATVAVLAKTAPALLHVDTVGDPGALAKALTAALKTPVPFATMTDPKAAR